MPLGRHDKRDCACVQHEPDGIWSYNIRMDGKNYYCRGCARYVSPDKWKGGLVEVSKGYKGTKFIYKEKNWCPCCGMRMAITRRSKNKRENSIKRQMENREMLSPIVKLSLPAKIAFIQSR